MKPPSSDAARLLLIGKYDELRERLLRVNADRRRLQDPLSLDSAERAVQRENDDTIDAIASSSLAEIGQIEAALSRMDAGRYGICEECARPIETDRLAAVPYATRCRHCSVFVPARAAN